MNLYNFFNLLPVNNVGILKYFNNYSGIIMKLWVQCLISFNNYEFIELLNFSCFIFIGTTLDAGEGFGINSQYQRTEKMEFWAGIAAFSIEKKWDFPQNFGNFGWKAAGICDPSRMLKSANPLEYLDKFPKYWKFWISLVSYTGGTWQKFKITF